MNLLATILQSSFRKSPILPRHFVSIEFLVVHLQVILIWRPLPDKAKLKREIRIPNYVYDIAEIFDINRLPEKPKSEPKPLPLEIRAFDRVPMANLFAVFPKTKLIFRPADAFIFDLVNVTTLLAVLFSVRFDSPRLDFLALVSGILWLLRTFFRYSNKLARYDLLVNKFLTRRISHRNSGALRYLLNQASTQKARRASLVHEWLIHLTNEKSKDSDELTRESIVRMGNHEINQFYRSKQPIQIDLDAALNDLESLGLVIFSNHGSILTSVKDGNDAKEIVKDLWNDLLASHNQ